MQRLKGISLPSLPSLPSRPFGSASTGTVPPPLPDERREALAQRKETVTNLLSAFASFHRTAAKERPNPLGGSEAALPLHWLGVTFVRQGDELAGQDDPAVESYGQALQKIGELHLLLAKLTRSRNDALALSYLTTLEGKVAEFKEFDKTVKEAEKARATLEALTLKVQKSKKDKSEYEAETEAAELAYEDACDIVARKARLLDDGVDREAGALADLVDAELEHATKYAALLTECRDSWPRRKASRSPPLHPRAASLAVPRAIMRTRSQSDSSVMQDVADKAAAASAAIRSTGNRRTTVSNSSAAVTPWSDAKDKDKERDGTTSPKSRSRSGSMLSRFTGSGKKEKKSRGPARDDDNSENEERLADELADDDDRDSYRSVSPTPFAMPSMPTLGSLKKLGSSGTGSKYDTLLGSDSSPSRSLKSSSSSPAMRQPPFKRTQTAPPLHTSNDLFEAKWAFRSDDTDESELPLEKGDVVRREREISAEWWVGTIVEGSAPGRTGMFPSNHVRPAEADEPGSPLMTLTPPPGFGRAATSSPSPKKAPPPPPSRRTTSPGRGLDSSPFAD